MANSVADKNNRSSDKMHNKNCFNYLANLSITPRVLDSLPPQFSALKEIHNNNSIYNPLFPYADLYTRFLDHIDKKTFINSLYLDTRQKILEQLELAEGTLFEFKQFLSVNEYPKFTQDILELEIKVDKLNEEKAKIEDQIDDMFISIYANNNHILKDTYAIIKDLTLQKTPVSIKTKSLIKNHLKDSDSSSNTVSQSPAQAELITSRLSSVFSDNYKPQHTTSLATVRSYRYTEESTLKEYRFGTQGQREIGKEQVSPLFKQFLKIQAKRSAVIAEELNVEPPVTHIYFNNLGRDRQDFEGLKEVGFTMQLENLETLHPNIAVITLPADKGLMDHNYFKETVAAHNIDQVKNQFFHIASESTDCDVTIKDFHISDAVREKIFKDDNGNYSKDAEQVQMKHLINQSFTALGLDKKDLLSSAEKQAVWFHFIKYELTNHIIDALTPPKELTLSINFSCKDAIDRGGISSAYYNVIKSFKSTAPMSRDEFEEALHAAPAMVKGRGMNDHLNLIWNTVDLYVNNNYNELKADKDKSWLIEWRDFNCPHERIELLINNRLPQIAEELNAAKQNPENADKIKALDKGIEILENIRNQTTSGVSGKRLLLESAVRTQSYIMEPSEEKAIQLDNVSKQLSINYPNLHALAGLIKSLVGVLIYAVTQNSNIMDKGWATFKAGVHSTERVQLQTSMKEQIAAIKNENEVPDIKEEHNNLSQKH